MALNVAQRHQDEELLDAPDRPADNPDADVDSDEKIARITREIEDLQRQMKDVTGMISGQPTGKTEFFNKKAELQRQLDECSRFVDDCQAKKEALSRSAGREKGSAQSRPGSQRRTPSRHSVSAEVEEQIRAIEQRMLTESLTLREEKQLLTEVAGLKANPRDAPQGMGDGDATAKDSGSSVTGSLEEISKQLLAHREKKRVLQAEYAALVSARKSQLTTLPRLHEDREALSQKLGAKIRERAAMRESVRTADKRFGQQLIAAQKARAEEARHQKAEGARERNDFRRQREADKLEDKPCQLEIALVEQTMRFCRSFLRTEVAKKEEAAIKYDTPAGAVVLLSKDRRDDDPDVAPVKRGKSNRSKAGRSTTIKHNAETFKFFEKLGIDAPTTTDDIPATLEKLEGLLQGYNQKVEEWAERRAKMKRNIWDEQPAGVDQPEPGRDDVDSEDLLRGDVDGVDVD